MNYSETVELEQNVKIKDQADKICRDFNKNVSLKISNFKGHGEFLLWSDANNTILVDVDGEYPVLICKFLHNGYKLEVSPSAVFNAIKSKYRGVDHLIAMSKKD